MKAQTTAWLYQAAGCFAQESARGFTKDRSKSLGFSQDSLSYGVRPRSEDADFLIRFPLFSFGFPLFSFGFLYPLVARPILPTHSMLICLR